MHAIWVEEARAFFRKQFGAETPTEVTPFGRGLAFALGFSYDDITVPWGNDAEDWDSGAARFPFVDIDANRAWLAVVCFADTLVRGFQLLCLTGALAVAEPKALRWGLWHAPTRLVHRARRRIVRILDGWPTTDGLLHAYRRIALIT